MKTIAFILPICHSRIRLLFQQVAWQYFTILSLSCQNVSLRASFGDKLSLSRFGIELKVQLQSGILGNVERGDLLSKFFMPCHDFVLARR